jgi:hypothetical protein
MRLLLSMLLLSAAAAACSFDSVPGPSDPDGPKPGEAEVVVDSAEEFAAGATLSNSYIREGGTVEPRTWTSGVLLAEIDNGAGPVVSWADKPARSAMENVGLMRPELGQLQQPPGAPSDSFNVWFTGQIRIDQGLQRIAIATSPGTTAFVDVVRADGTTHVHCTTSPCDVDNLAAGWYGLRAGWQRPINQGYQLQLQWASGSQIPSAIPQDRLRALADDPELRGWRMEGYEAPRSTVAVPNAIALNYKTPFTMEWAPSLLNLSGGSPSYRNVGQLRIDKAAMYEFTITAASEASYRLWIDGDWVSLPIQWEEQDSGVRTETLSKQLDEGWHDLVLEAYEHNGTGNSVTFSYGEQGQPKAPPAPADVRPVVGAAEAFATSFEGSDAPLVSDTPVERAMVVPQVTGATTATEVDISVQLNAKRWNDVTATVLPPGKTTPIPLTFSTESLLSDQTGEIHATVRGAQLGGAPVAGSWKVAVTHAGGGLNANNKITKARINVHYRGGPAIGSPNPFVATSATYSRVVELDAARELSGVLGTSITPAGSSIALTAQVCNDAAGTDCPGPQLTSEELEASKPMAQFVRVTAAFTSDGFAAPILKTVKLRYRK